MIQELLVLLVAMAAVWVLLFFGNRKKSFRYHQWWSPVAAMVVTLIGIYVYYDRYTEIVNFVKEVATPADAPMIINYLELLYSLGVIAFYALLKMGINGGESWFQNKPKVGEKPRLSVFSIAYMVDDENDVSLRKEFVFPSIYVENWLWIGFGIILLLVLLLFVPNASDSPVVRILPCFSVFMALEVFWYLQHPRIEQLPETPEIKAAATPTKTTDYYPLWEEYQKVWLDKILLAWQYRSPRYEQARPAAIQMVEAQNLVNAGYQLNVNDYHILERLSNRDDLLIDDVISDKVAPLLFSIFIRRLMDGENVLVLTGKRCTADSVYHQQIVNWISEWFYQLTGNRDFWKVQIFSKVEDVELSSRLIVSSANDILEKNITNHAWFDSLQTVLLLNGNEIFSESLTSNNILLRILRQKFNQLQTITLSDYRETLQSSVARNLHVKTDLKEVRVRPTSPAKTFALFWKLEGDRLFQQKVFSGHIEKHLGAEVILSLLGQREKLANIQLVGQENLPAYEYLEELDNNSSSLMTTPVSARSLTDKAVNVVHNEQVSFLMPTAKDSFILARDKEYNLVSCLRQWEAFAQDQAFVHIVSPPYLLRAYFLDNMSYFAKTPLYPLSAKMMISRFEVARILLERMVSQEMTENSILEEISWIDTKATFVKESLQKLFKLAFGIDIIASNYLNISTVYDFDKANDSFRKVTKYRLSPRIKDDLSLKFLRNVEIIDASKNVLKIMSGDLLFQNYLPNQIHAFAGKAYVIKGYDATNRKLLVNHRSPEAILLYRTDYSIQINSIEPPLTESHRKRISNSISLEVCEGRFSVKTNGYFTFTTAFHLTTGNYTYTPLTETEVPTREYTLGRMVLMNIEKQQLSFNSEDLAATLALLLQEVFYSLFPDTHQYIVVGAISGQNSSLSGNFAKLYPIIHADSGSNLSITDEQTIRLCIIEDASEDLGLVQSVFDQWEYILRIVDDYLDWVLDGTERTTQPLAPDDDKDQIFRKLKIHKTEFLQYGSELLPDFMNLKGTAALLRQLLGRNYLTTGRRDYYN
ncbi:MAG: hypothetical protein JNM36_18860 [Chitinophagales bacterium]|nr:hypothetical protein [Chitinophagales bacterium]